MNNTENIKQALDSFINGELKVLVLKGSWGVGKTHYWEKYIEEKIKQKELKPLAYSYVSLFALKNLTELKEAIFHNGVPLKTEQEIEEEFKKAEDENNKLYKYCPWVKKLKKEVDKKSPLLGLISRFGKHLPMFNKLLPLINSAEYGLVNNYLICFDDIERKGTNLPIKELMGLVDQLTVRKKCKIILIFNYQSLEKENIDKLDYDLYREKVVDLEIEFNPSIKENLLHVFPVDHKYFDTLLNVFNVLNIPNIRIFKKTKWAIEKISDDIQICDIDLQHNLIEHLSIFCWAHFHSEGSLPISFISEQLRSNPLLSLMTNKGEEKVSREMKLWKHISSSLLLSSELYDDSLIALLSNGYIPRDEFISSITKSNKDIETTKAKSELYKAWDLFSNSFEDNQELFLNKIETALSDNLDKIGIMDFSSGIDVLEEYEKNVSKIVQQYIEINKKKLSSFLVVPHHLIKKIHNKELLESIKNDKNENRNIDQILTKIAGVRGWNPGDINFLSSLTTADIYKWIKSNPNDIVTKIQNGLLFFDNLQTINVEDNERHQIIVKNTKEALKKVANENNFNKNRVKSIYNI